MIKDELKYIVAESTAWAFREVFKDSLREFPDDPEFDAEKLYGKIERPKDLSMGDYALPLFETAKRWGVNPVELNKKLLEGQKAVIASNPEKYPLVYSIKGGFNNSKFAPKALAKIVLKKVLDEGEDFGSSDVGQSKTIVIDFSSPNIAKPFGVGHLRSTAIGACLYRVFKKLGYTPVGINHLGDWGTQFGKLIVAYRMWGGEGLGDDPIEKLNELYVRFHKEEENNPDMSDKAREAFKALESGSQEEAELWKEFVDLSLEEFQKTYDILGITFDYHTGESFYNDKMDAAVERLKAAGLTEISDGALVINLDKYNLPPCLLTKADGATLYATRDLAGIFYRWNEFKFDRALYVVNAAQRVHFQQVFKVVELLEEAEKTPEDERMSNRLEHVQFGWIRFNEKAMSTRKGNIVILKDVLHKAAELARKIILEKNPDLENIDRTARMIGTGAVIFADLSTRKHIDVNFDWDAVLSFEGETGPYLQYTHARLCSLLRKYGREISQDIDFKYLSQPEENRVLHVLYRFPQVVEEAASGCEPFMISSYLLEVASAYNSVYQMKDDEGRIIKIISDDETATVARMALVEAVRIVINEGLQLLGIEAPEEM